MQRTLISKTAEEVGKDVKIQGWVNTVRSHGKIIFIDLRDRSGIVQTVLNEDIAKQGKNIRDEFVLEMVGTVKERPAEMVNDKIETGKIEIEIRELNVLNESQTPPFELTKDTSNIDESLRMKYRYLDLRSQRMQKNMKIRSEFVRNAREFLFGEDFTEIETPLLTKSTPEGSRDFVVPSRFAPGKFYALPQSPQQYKQLLMTAGFERYFQIARAIRDEDLRADRGFEHTQIDLEMSFVKMEDVMNTVEAMVTSTVEKMGFKIKEKPFPRISYKNAIEKYGADKFDMRTEEDKANGVLAYAWVVEFPFFEKTEDGGWTFSHNPFSMPIDEHIDWVLEGKNIEQILTTQYDLVCNGYESGGGSIRSHRSDILKATYKIMGYSEEETQESVGHMIEALDFGTPPHGGIALGVERNIMNLTGEEYLREVQTFPMTGTGQTSVMDAPSPLSDKQLGELGIKIKGGSLYERIQDAMINSGVDYQEYHHEDVMTSEQAAEVRGTPLNEGAKALIFHADGKQVLFVVEGDKKLSKEKIKESEGFEKLKMVSLDEVEAISGVPIGAVPPFGRLFATPIEVYVNKALLENEFMEFNAGDRGISMRMKTSDWSNIVKPIIGDYEE